MYRIVTNGEKFKVQQKVWIFWVTMQGYGGDQFYESYAKAEEWIVAMVKRTAEYEPKNWAPVGPRYYEDGTRDSIGGVG